MRVPRTSGGASAEGRAADAVLPDDLGVRTMLGDPGAQAPGAVLGAAVVIGTGRARLLAHAAAVMGAAVYGDRVSELARAS